MGEKLIEMFKRFNDQVDGIYFVDQVDNKVKFAQEEGCLTICSLEDIKDVRFSERGIFLDADENWTLTTSGAEF